MPRNVALEMEAMQDPEQAEFFHAVRTEFLEVLADKELPGVCHDDVLVAVDANRTLAFYVDGVTAGTSTVLNELALSSFGATLADLAAFAALEVKRRNNGQGSLRVA